MAYPVALDLPTFKSLTVMPPEDVDLVENKHPGFVATQIAGFTSEIYSRLAKRYSVPPVPPATTPAIVQLWLTWKTTPEVMKKRGVNPESAQYAEMVKMADKADAQVKEAADCVTGLFDLPLIEQAGGTASAITQSLSRSSSDPDPYSWTDVQAIAVQNQTVPVVVGR